MNSCTALAEEHPAMQWMDRPRSTDMPIADDGSSDIKCSLMLATDGLGPLAASARIELQ